MKRLHAVLSFAAVLSAALLVSAPTPPFTPNQKAFYMSERDVTFVRPGLVIRVTGAEIAADGTIRARFRLADLRGLPLDREGIATPGTVAVSFIAAYIPRGQTQYISYTTRVQTSPITNKSETQAAGQNNGTFRRIADGEYEYTFSVRAPSTIDRAATHSIGAYGSRNLSEFDLGTQYDDDVYNFVPSGARVTQVRDVIKTATCNTCHHDMAFHGGSRKTMELCVLCHTPQTIDPDTGNSVDMPVMTHKIHMGSSLPSVRAGGKYVIIGNQQSVHDYSEVVFPAGAQSCTMCHVQQGPNRAAQAENVFKGNRAACGACHDDVDFNTGAGHVDLPQVSDNQCTNCHVPRGELDFDASIMGAHTITGQSGMLPGVVFDILRIDDAAPGRKPVVTFTIKDRSGQPLKAADMTRLTVYLAGPSGDYSTYFSEDARRSEGPGDGRHFHAFDRALPADAKGTWTVAVEGRKEIRLLEGTRKERLARDTGVNKQMSFSVDGSRVAPRRTVVSTAKCNACHGALAFHGQVRNEIAQCVVCHNPTMTGGGNTIDMRMMTHMIHMGRELERPYVFGNTSFNNVGYPGQLRRCDACHVNGSENLPLREGLLPVNDPRGLINPVGPITAACTSCHAGRSAVSHALANTNALGEACASCHGTAGEFSVARVHAQ